MKPTPEQLKGEHGICETVKVKADNDDGFMIINESDFDEKVHVKFKEAKKPAAMDKAT